MVAFTDSRNAASIGSSDPLYRIIGCGAFYIYFILSGLLIISSDNMATKKAGKI
jgi:hypothetical protein